MNKILVKGTQTFLKKKIPIIEGGFGATQKVILVKTVAEIHQVALGDLNKLIRNNICEFEFGIDILDLKNDEGFAIIAKNSGLYNQNALNASTNIYLLSEQGYMALVQLMRTEKAKQIRKQLRREYFAMRETINSSEQLKAMALLKALEGVTESERLEGLETYSNIKAAEEAKPLLEEIDHLKRFLNNKKFTKQELAIKLDTNTTKMAKILKELKIYTKDCNVTQWFKNRCPNVTLTIVAKGEFTVNGVRKSKVGWQWTTEGAYEVIKYLLENGKVIETSNHLFKLA